MTELALPLFAFLVAVAPRIELRLETSELVRRALAIHGYSLKRAAIEMGIAQAELSRMLNNRGVNLDRLDLLGAAFMQTLAGLIHARATGAPLPSISGETEKRLLTLETQMRSVLAQWRTA